MNTVTQTMKYRQALIKYSQKYDVTKAAIRYKTNRQYVYRWMKRYDGTIQSLADKSHRPHHHPNQHTEAELKLIKDMRRRNPNAGLVVFWVKLMQRGYSRSITGLYRVLKRNGEMAVKPKNPKYIPKPYEKMYFPGQRVQVDVKFVPASCIVGAAKGEKYYPKGQPIKFCVNNNPSSNKRILDCGAIRLSDLPRVNSSFLSAECYARRA